MTFFVYAMVAMAALMLSAQVTVYAKVRGK